MKKVSIAPEPRSHRSAAPASKRAAPSRAPSSRGVSKKADVRAAAKRSAPAKRGATKKRVARVVETSQPIKNKMSQGEFIQHLIESSGVEIAPRDMKRIYDALIDTICGSLHPKGAGEFVLPKIAKFVTKKIPASKGGKKMISPFTGEEMITKPKPARIRIKARVLTNIKRLSGCA